MELDTSRQRLLDLLASDTPDHAELAELKQEILAETSGTEPPSPPPDATDTAFAEATIASAALRGAFSLDDPDIPLAARPLLVPLTEPVTQDGVVLLSLRVTPRMQALAALRDDGALTATLQSTTLPAGDLVGAALRDLLAETYPTGQLNDPVTLSDARLEAWLQVAGWFAAAPEGWPPDLGSAATALRREAALRAMRKSDAALIGRFHGRSAELAQLSGFLRRKKQTADPPRIFAMSAEGGAGKSALIAKFADTLRRSRRKPAWVIIRLDFDRRVLTASDPLQLTFEVTRQLALQFPELDQPLANLRRNTRRNAEEMAASIKSSGRSAGYRAISETVWGISAELRRIGALERPILMILDTLEEALSYRSPIDQDMTAAMAIREWLRMFPQTGMTGLRVILSGRGIDKANEAPFFAETVMPLEELDLDSAIHILRDRGKIPPHDAERLAQAFPRSPLVLRFVAELATGPDPIPVSELVDLGAKDTGYGDDAGDIPRTALVQGMLYGRILAHIKNESVRALAHPGLVLRRVTPQLIHAILATHCLPGPVTEGEARDLYASLVEEHWLVSEEIRGVEAQHRRELRRIMLRLIAIDPAKRATAALIHQDALAFYQSGSDLGLDSGRAAQEAAYHRIMLGWLPESLTERQTLAQQFDRDIADFPESAQAALLSAAGKPLSDRQGRFLNGKDRGKFLAERGWDLVSHDRPEIALALLSPEERAKLAQSGWVVQAQIDLGRWADVPMQPPEGTVRDGRDLIPLITAQLLAERYADALATAIRALDARLQAHFALRIGSYSAGSAEFHADVTALMKRAMLAHLALGGTGLPNDSAILSAMGAMGTAHRAMAPERAIDLGHLVMLLHRLGADQMPDLVALVADHLRFVDGLDAVAWPVETPIRDLLPPPADRKLPEGSPKLGRLAMPALRIIWLLGPVAREWARRAHEAGMGVLDPRDLPPERVRHYLRGSTTEFHGAARLALFESVDTLPVASALYREMAGVWPYSIDNAEARTIAATALRGGLPFWSAIVEFADRSNCLVSLLLVASRLVTQSDNARRLNDIATALVRWQLLLLGAGRASRTSPSIAVQESTIPDNDQAFSAED